MSDDVVVPALIATSIAAVIVFRFLSRRRLMVGRSPMAAALIHAPVASEVSLDVFQEVLQVLGTAYAIDPALIRAEDLLDRLLEADSWTLHAGTERLEHWLQENGVDTPSTPPLTVLDLARLVESHRQQVG